MSTLSLVVQGAATKSAVLPTAVAAKQAVREGRVILTMNADQVALPLAVAVMWGQEGPLALEALGAREARQGPEALAACEERGGRGAAEAPVAQAPPAQRHRLLLKSARA